MSASAASGDANVGRYRLQLLIAMMLVIGLLTALGIFLAERKVAIETRLDLLHDFEHELATLHGIEEVRDSALAERCRGLVGRPRIHAALEDNALDLLYPSAKDELRDILQPGSETTTAPQQSSKAQFYRFLDSDGRMILPPADAEVGELLPEEEQQLALPSLTGNAQTGFLLHGTGQQATTAIHEILALPITSTDTGETIAALVLGFSPVEFGRGSSAGELKSGIWSNGRLYLPAVDPKEREILSNELARTLFRTASSEKSLQITVSGAPQLLFYKQLNPESLYPPAFEIAVYPLAPLLARQRQIRTQVILAGSALLLAGLIASHFMSRRLSAPVEQLAVTSEQHRAGEVAAKKALESTSAELRRSARFSADASHQLKTPVTVLRAGVERLLAREDFTPEVYDELSALLHQTYRITGVVDDLLLLSRMDAGHLQIQIEPVNLSHLLAEWIDDMKALPDELPVEVKTNFPPGLIVLGERRYIALIVQNLLENARKYNVAGGEICVAAQEWSDLVALTIENTGPPIPTEARDHIFERFHRGAMGENVAGQGLGLNLARELARLHGGDVRLVRSDGQYTEFEVTLRKAILEPATRSQKTALSTA